MRFPWRAILCACWASQLLLPAQTALDLRTQTKNVDFSQAATTKPNKIGETLPGACGVGETYFLTGAMAGQNLFFCTATNTWTQMAAGGGGSAIPMAALGDTIYADAAGKATRLGGNTTIARQFLTQTGTGSASAPPAWGSIVSGDVTAALGYAPENVLNRGTADGYAPLDSTGRVPANHLPASIGTVTNSNGALMSGAIVVGNGSSDARASAVMVDSSDAVNAGGGFNSLGAGNGMLALSGATSGTVSQTVQPAAGTWTFTWPSGPAASHQFLTTDSSGNASFSQPTVADLPVTGTGATIPALAATPTVGNCLNWSAGGVHDSGVACGGSGGGGLADPGSNGMLKRTALNTTAAAVAGVDFQQPLTLTTTGTSGPATLVAGTLNVPQYSGGSGGYDPFDATTEIAVEPFCPGNPASLSIGTLGWYSSVTLTAPDGNNEPNHPCLYGVPTAATANGIATVALTGNGATNRVLPAGPISTATNWTALYIFKTPASLAEMKIRVGLKYDATDTDLQTLGLRFGNSTGCTTNLTDAYWAFEAGDAAATTTSVTAITPQASTWYAFKMGNTGVVGHVQMSLSVAGGAWSTPVDITANLYGYSLRPFFQVINCGTTARTMVLDYFAFKQTGLAR
jgi:hypothetical protein